MVRHIARTERIVSIEDTVELQAQGQHVVRLETRPANVERQGEVTQRDLVKNALRMRPDRIVVGEVRGGEALDMLQAMNTGHRGSITTIHANSPRDALARLETMILMAGVNLTSEGMRRQISSGINIIVQLNRFPDGVRRVVSLYEVAGMEEQIIKLQEITRYQESPTPGPGKFVPTGVLPVHYDELSRTGVSIPRQLLAAGR
jgi:pilus assembly protein CpaF